MGGDHDGGCRERCNAKLNLTIGENGKAALWGPLTI